MRSARLPVRLTAALAVAVLGLWTCPGHAQTLQETLALAYANNPTLNAQRARLRATDERVPQALSGFRPSLRASTEVGRRYLDSNREYLVDDTNNALWAQTYGATLEQPLYRGGQTFAAVRGAENTVRAERARLLVQEQTTLLSAATAYCDVYRDQAVVDLTISNEQRLKRQLEATRDRFEVGEVTRTDVYQAEARLAQASADRFRSEGTLQASRANFRSVVGVAPAILKPPAVLGTLPDSLAGASERALNDNPNVTAQIFDERSALDNVDQVRGQLLPSVSLVGRVEREVNVGRSNSHYDSAEALLSLNVPIYQEGSVYSRLREARQVVVQQRRLLDQNQRTAVEDATRSWDALTTARAAIQALRKQVEANTVALDGVQKEADVGARTVLDILNAEQELLQSRVDLVRAEHDEVVAGYQLQSATGDLTATQLALDVDHYDPTEHYQQVRGLWFGSTSEGDNSGDFGRRARSE